MEDRDGHDQPQGRLLGRPIKLVRGPNQGVPEKGRADDLKSSSPRQVRRCVHGGHQSSVCLARRAVAHATKCRTQTSDGAYLVKGRLPGFETRARAILGTILEREDEPAACDVCWRCSAPADHLAA